MATIKYTQYVVYLTNDWSNYTPCDSRAEAEVLVATEHLAEGTYTIVEEEVTEDRD